MTPSRPRPVVAIDGPAGAGKSTAARLLAQKLGFTLVDTGALYRGVALAARERGVSWDDGPGLAELGESLSLELAPGPGGAQRVLVDGADRTADIRTPDISMGASHVSKHVEVRAALLGLQRRLGEQGGVVLEGRDIGTVVFPDAEVKAFVTASPATRAHRRQKELVARGIAATFESTLAEVEARDEQDSTRAVAPLRPAGDAVVLDTSDMAIDEVVSALAGLVQNHTPR